jgi:hypothetical protein
VSKESSGPSLPGHPALVALIEDYRTMVEMFINERCVSEEEIKQSWRKARRLIGAAIKEAEGEVAR